jgi:hypothetical protein
VTHRDPLIMLASLTSLIATLRWAHSDAVDYPAIARAHALRYRASLDRLMQWTDSERVPAAQLHHSRYEDFLEDPLAVLAALYARFGRPFGDELQSRVREALAARTAGEHGEHDYCFDDLGLDRSALRKHFRVYQERFAVPNEE